MFLLKSFVQNSTKIHKQLVKKNLDGKIFLKKKKSFIASAEKRH
jgi:hypothetical protein